VTDCFNGGKNLNALPAPLYFIWEGKPYPMFASAQFLAFSIFLFLLALQLPTYLPALCLFSGCSLLPALPVARDYRLRTAFTCVLGTSMVRQTPSAAPL
jgi:hypothetical protein